MQRYFIDSNVFLRYYHRDDPKQSDAAEDVLLRAKNRMQAS